ncbi:MAG: hypothetical protein QM541_10870 [Flavobacterium sp.]|nr:hypothetical protein [Flavobacterium sp.]
MPQITKSNKQYSKATLIITKFTPVNYYTEERITSKHIAQYLQDASIEEFVTIYKNYNTNYFEKLGYKNVIFYSFGALECRCTLHFKKQFFTTYQQNKYYCKKSSFNSITSMLDKEKYRSKESYLQALKDLYSKVYKHFDEGNYLISFHFYNHKKYSRIVNYKSNYNYSQCCGLAINNWQ